MDIKGVCYDVGRAYSGYFLTRRVFDPATTRRELQIIRDDLHCNAVRFQRTDKGTHVRDEEHQARELTKTLGILDAEGLDGAFVWTFADPWLTHTADPRHDLDMTATSLVKTYARGHGTTYPDLPWEPKQAFGAVVSFYATH
jgi:hypothetical protein